MASYLVAGAAGFIGSRVAELLLQAGHAVAGLDNFSDSYDVRLKEWRLRRLLGTAAGLGASDRLTFHRADLRRRRRLRQIFRSGPGFDAVFNLAARAGVRQSVLTPWDYYETNVDGHLNLLHCCFEFGVGKFVLASSSSLYGETKPEPVGEDAPTDRPLSPYAASKKAAETLCHSYHKLHGVDVTVFRYFTVYGPAGRPDMSPFRFVQWIAEGREVLVYGDGGQSRDFTHVDDIARGTVLGLRPVGYEIFNLGAGRPAPLSELIARIERRLGRTARLIHLPRHGADVDHTWADIGKARSRLGWRPEIGLGQGVESLTEWYLANRDWAASIQA